MKKLFAMLLCLALLCSTAAMALEDFANREWETFYAITSQFHDAARTPNAWELPEIGVKLTVPDHYRVTVRLPLQEPKPLSGLKSYCDQNLQEYWMNPKLTYDDLTEEQRKLWDVSDAIYDVDSQQHLMSNYNSNHAYFFAYNSLGHTDMEVISYPVYDEALADFDQLTGQELLAEAEAIATMPGFSYQLHTLQNDQLYDSMYTLQYANSRLYYWPQIIQKKSFTSQSLIKSIATGMAAEAWDGRRVTVAEGLASEYQPIVDIGEGAYINQGTKMIYPGHINTFLEAGFHYYLIGQDEYLAIRAWEEQTGKHVLYPMLDENSTYYIISYANGWYKSQKNAPVMTGENGDPIQIEFSPDMTDLVLEDIYLRDMDGRPIYYISSGDKYKVRVLYYNYFQYKYDLNPADYELCIIDRIPYACFSTQGTKGYAKVYLTIKNGSCYIYVFASDKPFDQAALDDMDTILHSVVYQAAP